jgi:hypothetical protein
VAVTAIKELRIFPPLAIARFGASPEPLENYEVKVIDPFGFRRIQQAPTLIVNPDTGAIDQETKPDPTKRVAFRDAQGRVKPLAPFLEVWARFADGGDFEPLTKNHLADLQLQPADVEWGIQAANIKAFRRTGHVADQVVANVAIAKSDDTPHDARPLLGQCPNFKLDANGNQKSISFGTVRYIRPTDTFPEIRIRFTPAAGLVFGPRAGDPLVMDDVYLGITSTPTPPHGPWAYPFAGAWDRYWIGAPNSPPVTAPGDIFQGQLFGGTKVSDGYLDDTCDGIVEVRLRVGGRLLTAYARLMSGVPDFAPDSYHVRTIADDLEQMAFGPDVAAPADAATKARLKADVVDILRRAYETVRLMNTSVQNGDQGVGGVQVNRNNMAGQQNGSYNRAFEPFFPTQGGQAKYANALEKHRRLLKAAIDAAQLEGSFAFLDLVRPYHEIGLLTTEARQRMPAMMRGSDGLELALTRRQRSKLKLASPAVPPPAPAALAAAAAVVPPPITVRPLASLPPVTRHALENEP